MYLRHFSIKKEKKTLRTLKLCKEVSFKKHHFTDLSKLILIWHQNSELISILNANLSELLEETSLKVIAD